MKVTGITKEKEKGKIMEMETKTLDMIVKELKKMREYWMDESEKAIPEMVSTYKERALLYTSVLSLVIKIAHENGIAIDKSWYW